MTEKEYCLDDFDYDLPEELIAQKPCDNREESRLFVLKRKEELFLHKKFSHIGEFLRDDDVLVFNDARVIQARIFVRRETGGRVEMVLARNIDQLHWLVITNRTKKLKEGEKLFPGKDGNTSFTVKGRDGEYIEIESSRELTAEYLETIGEVPLPPYIKRDSSSFDAERYQTVYSSNPGAVAAPTAGLHFTDKILEDLNSRGMETLFLTLYVSWGTFSPVRDNDLAKHNMHSERYVLTEEIAEKINSAREKGRRIIAVGTTSLRVLESTFHDGKNVPGTGDTDIFIYPPMKVKSIDSMITNLHTPKSTLLMLISAFAGYDLTIKAYEEAVKERYRFFSYGDSMFIE